MSLHQVSWNIRAKLAEILAHAGATCGMLAGMDSDIPVIVRMHVECARCGHAEDDTYEFDLPFAKAQAMEAYEPGKCSKCGGPIHMRLKRTQRKR